tara:strand:+ start:1236 stop:1571 length:336 start_codon:yes stop_codon:yes gene_type:complete
MEPNEIRKARMERGLTIQEVSDKIGAPYSAVHRWEMGKNKPSAKYISALTRLLNDGDLGETEASEVDFLKKRILDLEALVESQKQTIELQAEALKIAKTALTNIKMIPANK